MTSYFRTYFPLLWVIPGSECCSADRYCVVSARADTRYVTRSSYYYHHNKMHHTEGNGPEDLSSTIRYQRDSPYHFLRYLLRFICLISLDLPRYFWRKGQRTFAIKAALWDWSSYSMIALGLCYNARAATFCLLLPFVILRIGLMIGNWGE